MAAASAVEFCVQLIGFDSKLPNDKLNVRLPAVFRSAVANVNRCTSLVGRRELGALPATAVTWPAVATLIGATGTFCNALLKMISKGPPALPTTSTLPVRSGMELS